VSFEAYLVERVKRETLCADTVRNLVFDANQHAEWLAARKIYPSNVDKDRLESYLHWLESRYRFSTVRRKAVSLRRFYSFAQERGLVSSNPAQHLEIPRDGRGAQNKTHPRIREIAERLLNAPDRNTPKGARDQAILSLIIIHGLRVSEIHQLNVADVSLDKPGCGAIRIPSSARSQSIVLLDADAAESLSTWLVIRRLLKPDCDGLFASLHWTAGRSEPGQRLSRRGVRQIVDSCLIQIGAKRRGMSCETLRFAASGLGIAEAGSECRRLDE